MSKYLHCFKQFALLSLKDMSVFRSDFILSMLHLIIYQGIFIIFWNSILNNIDSPLPYWGKFELALLILSTLVYSSIKLLFYGLSMMGEKVLSGEIDKYLCRPISPLFSLLAEDMKVWASIHSLITCMVLLVASLYFFEGEINLTNVAIYSISIFLGSLTLILLDGCVSLLSFWFGDISKLAYTVNSFFEFQRYPLTILPLFLNFFLTWVLPIGLISTIPVLLLTGALKSWMPVLIGQCLLLSFWIITFTFLWKKAIGRYDSLGG